MHERLIVHLRRRARMVILQQTIRRLDIAGSNGAPVRIRGCLKCLDSRSRNLRRGYRYDTQKH